MIFKASHSRLHDSTLMKQHTSAGCLEMFSNEQACITLFKFLCCNVAFYSLISLETIEKVYSLSGKKIVFMSSTSHVGYVKSIQQSASAVAEYPNAFDSTLQSERLHFTVHIL